MTMYSKYAMPMLLFASTLVAACAQAHSHIQVSPPSVATDHNVIVFRVASTQSDQMLSGVKVSMLGRDGSAVDLGQTDMFGQLAVPKAILRDHGALVVLFSHDHFFTGAIRTDVPGFDFYSFDERYIELAVFAVI